jgi:hypothetical protein
VVFAARAISTTRSERHWRTRLHEFNQRFGRGLADGWGRARLLLSGQDARFDCPLAHLRLQKAQHLFQRAALRAAVQRDAGDLLAFVEHLAVAVQTQFNRHRLALGGVHNRHGNDRDRVA